MKTSLPQQRLDGVLEALGRANRKLAESHPGDGGGRQPLHTVYGGAHLFKASTAPKMGEIGLRSLDEYAPDAETFAKALGLPEGAGLHEMVYARVREKLQREPVEDFRIDFEDGFGNRPDPEEDETAVEAAKETAKGMREGTLPPFCGIRIKPFNEELKARSLRTLDLFVTTLVGETGGKLPDHFVVTLAKVSVPEQVAALADAFDGLEEALGLDAGRLKLELMVELPEAIVDAEGRCPLPALVDAARGRCIGAHFGTYDYTAACNITAEWQRMQHPACDFAKHVMQVALSGKGLMLSDGATNILPAPPHGGDDLTAEQRLENRETVHRAWRLAHDDIRHSLVNGFYQGWDLHPGQLPVRYGTAFAFFLEGFDEASSRLKNFVDRAAKATLAGDVFDDAATGQGLLNYFLRALNSGAITEDEVTATGLTVEEVRQRSFLKILEARRAQSS